MLAFARSPRLTLVLLAAWTLLLIGLSAGCSAGPSQREVALRATVEALHAEADQLRAATPGPRANAPVPTPTVSGSLAAISQPSAAEWWVCNHRATTLWTSGSGGKAVATLPQWSYMLVMEPQSGGRLRVFLPAGQRASHVGDGWVDAIDLGPIGVPPAGAVDLASLPKQRWVPLKDEPTPTTRIASSPFSGSKLLEWREVNLAVEEGDLELRANLLLLGQESYGGPYGSRIAATNGTKIVLADVTLTYAFRPGASATEIHVDFFVIGDAAGQEYRGLPVPISNALPDRFFLSPGQAFRGIVAFIVPAEMSSGRLYFTNFLGTRKPQERLTVYLKELP